jgi:hypothetical protein
LHPYPIASEELLGVFSGGLRVVPLATEDVEVDGVAVFSEMGRYQRGFAEQMSENLLTPLVVIALSDVFS